MAEDVRALVAVMNKVGLTGDGRVASDDTTGEDAAAEAESDQSGCLTIKNPVCCFKKCVRDQSGILVDQEEAKEEKQKILNRLDDVKKCAKRMNAALDRTLDDVKNRADRMNAALAVPNKLNEADVTAKTLQAAWQDLEHCIAALYQSAGIDKGFVETFLGLSCGMKTFQLINYAMTAFDVIDGGLDFAAVYELAQYRETVPHAVLLAATTVITLAVELWLKAGVWTKQSASTKEGDIGDLGYDLNTANGRAAFIITCAVLEVTIFFIEDATTLFIFWQTGLAGSSVATTANLYFSLASGVIALLGFVYGLSRVLKNAANGTFLQPSPLMSYPRKSKKEIRTWQSYSNVTFMAAVLGFWFWFAIAVINEGAFYNCIGGCAAKADAVAENPALFAALAEALDQTVKSLSIADAELLSVAAATIIGGLSPDWNTTTFGNVDGSGEAIVVVGGSSNSSLAENAAFGFGSHTAKDESVNKAVLAMYIIGWLFAVKTVKTFKYG